MKKTKKILVMLLIVLAAVTFVACSGKNEDNGKSSIVVTDMTGREIGLDKPAEKVVVLTPGDCEIVFALGCGDKVVGRGEYCNYPEDVNDITMLKSGAEINVEEIIALQPDVVIMSPMGQSEEQVIDALSKAGIVTLLNDANNIEQAYTAIENIGKILGKDNEAAELVQSMKDAFAEITVEMPAEPKTVYFEVSPLEYGLWTAGADTYMNEMCEMLGVKNAFEDVYGWAQISQEQVIERNPDYIVTITMYYGEGLTPVEEIMGREGWEGITAIQNGKVLNANSDEISRPSPRLVDAANALSDFFK